MYPAFFRALSFIEIRWPDSFFLNLLRESISLALHGVVGFMFLRLFLRLPRSIEWIAGIFMGIGLATFILELWAIPFLLDRWTVLLSLLALGLLFYAAKRFWGWAEEEVSVLQELPLARWDKVLFGCAAAILGLITLLSFYHALLFPVDYWDALILYIHYGKMTYQQGGFPVLVCLQVGLGLGANYPHLYPLHQAATAMLFGQWADLYGQLLPPLAGLGSILIAYCLAVRLFRHRLTAVFSTLAFRSVPFVSTYFVWASDYSLVMLYTLLFLLFLEAFVSNSTIRRLFPLLAVAAIFPHINYLGWIVWPPLLLAILWRYPAIAEKSSRGWICIGGWLVFWFGWGLTWYVRNWLVTGNPVYAFFPQIFGGININLEVLESCNLEWMAHGQGAAQFGDTLWQKVVNSLIFFQTDWRFAPWLTGIMLPGLLLGWKRRQPFFVIAAFLFALYFVYQYIISGLYWYHTIAALPILGLFVGRFLSQAEGDSIRRGFYYLFLVAALVPGVSVAIMGPKMPSAKLPLFSRPGLSPEEFYLFAGRLGKYDYKDAPAWSFVNKNLENGAVILTHDNRYHVYRDDISIVHLDDCGLTPFYGKSYPDVHRELLRRSIHYYLYISDEDSHPITARLGHKFYLNNPDYYELLYEAEKEENHARLYRLKNGEGN